MNLIRPWLYVGTFRETLNHVLLEQYDIKAMLQLSEEIEQPGIRSLFLEVEDMDPIPMATLRQGTEFVRAEKAAGHNVLIACGAGINRSTIFAAAALKEEENLGLLEALLQVRQKHPDALPHPPGWESLCEYYNEHVPYRAVIPIVKPSKHQN